jgi:hypothetical protein
LWIVRRNKNSITADGRAVMAPECDNTRQALRRINDPAQE